MIAIAVDLVAHNLIAAYAFIRPEPDPVVGIAGDDVALTRIRPTYQRTAVDGGDQNPPQVTKQHGPALVRANQIALNGCVGSRSVQGDAK